MGTRELSREYRLGTKMVNCKKAATDPRGGKPPSGIHLEHEAEYHMTIKKTKRGTVVGEQLWRRWWKQLITEVYIRVRVYRLRRWMASF